MSINEYEVTINHIEHPPRDKFFDYGSVRVSKYNRTTYMINGELELLRDITDNMRGEFTISHLKGNEYKVLLVKKYSMICSFLKDDIFVMPRIRPYINRPRQCPVKAGKFIIDKLTNPPHKLPITPPAEGKYKVDVRIIENDEILQNISVFGTVTKLPNKIF